MRNETLNAMDKLFERHDEYLSIVPMEFIRSFMQQIDWSLRLIAIKGPKGVGKPLLTQLTDFAR